MDNLKIIADLRRGSVGDVHAPGEPGYTECLASLFTSEAALARPVAIVQPASTAELVRAVQVVRRSGQTLTVRGGGLSTSCAVDGCVMLDLSARLPEIAVEEDMVRAGGGATMGSINAALAESGVFLPVGVSPLPGLGLATRGGIGHFSRSFGLTLDHIVEVEVVTGSGEVRLLDAGCAGFDADMWWAVRGCPAVVGVVSSIRLRTRRCPTPVWVWRALLDIGSFPAFVEWAAGLPDSISASAVLTIPPRERHPALFLYLAGHGEQTPSARQTEEEIRGWARGIVWSATDECTPSTMPAFDPPGRGGSPATPAPPPPPDQRIFFAEKCPFLKNLDGPAAEKVVRLLRRAPTPFCRQDFQHSGGQVASVAPSSSAFFCRDFAWNSPIIAPWQGEDPALELACSKWVQSIWDSLSSCIVGAYSTEIRAGLPETAAELALAFGRENLGRLRSIRERCDPDRVILPGRDF